MKLPSIKIEFIEDEDLEVGRISPALVVGFGLHWAWIYLSIYNGSSIFSISADEFNSYLFTGFLVVFTLVLVSYGAFINSSRRLFAEANDRKRNRIIGAAAMILSIFCLILYAQGSFILCLVSGILFSVLAGLGSAVLFMSFSVSFSICDTATAAMAAGLGIIIAAAIYDISIMLGLKSAYLCIIVCLALPAIEVLCLNKASQQLVDNLAFHGFAKPVNSSKFALIVGGSSLFFGIAIGFTRGIILPVDSTFFLSEDTPTTALLAALAVTIFAYLATLARRKEANYILRTQLPIIVTFLGVSILPNADLDLEFSSFSLLLACFSIELCIWVFYSSIAQRYRISAFVTFGIGRGLASFGILIAHVVIISVPQITSQTYFVYLILGIIVALVWAYCLLPSTKAIFSTMIDNSSIGAACTGSGKEKGLCKGCTHAAMKLLNDSVRTYFKSINEGEKLAPNSNSNSDNGSGNSDNGSGNSDNGSGNSDNGSGNSGGGIEPASVYDIYSASSAAAAEGKNNTPIPAEEHISDATQGNRCMHNENKQFASTGVDKAVPEINTHQDKAHLHEFAQDQNKKHLDLYERQCLAVADTYLLSKRETEVLFLLARGKNKTSVQEILYISSGTANTHMRHIYAKLDVHSQQELISLVESFEIPATS